MIPDLDLTGSTPAKLRKPRIALMGEFSAGKSTLTNLLIGADAIPMRVTATQLPPVWLSFGDDPPYRIATDGTLHRLPRGARLEGIPVRETAFIRMFARAEVLELCDIIDTPGISDPNMDAEIWQRAVAKADGVLWLTHATQAWRQSEAAVWDSLPSELWSHSLLLLTRIDKLLTERDRARVLARVRKETEGLFRDVLPISVLQAIEADGDQAKWEASGGAAFAGAMLALVQSLKQRVRNAGAAEEPQPRPEDFVDAPAEPAVAAAAPVHLTHRAASVGLRVVTRPVGAGTGTLRPPRIDLAEPARPVAPVPRRVVRPSPPEGVTPRPAAPGR